MAALGLVAVISICDGLQAVLIGATRGAADTVVPTVLQGVSFWVIMVPLNYYFSGAAGLGHQRLVPGHRHQRAGGQLVPRHPLRAADAEAHSADLSDN